MNVTLFPNENARVGDGCDDYGRSFIYVEDSKSGITVEIYLHLEQRQKLKKSLLDYAEKKVLNQLHFPSRILKMKDGSLVAYFTIAHNRYKSSHNYLLIRQGETKGPHHRWKSWIVNENKPFRGCDGVDFDEDNWSYDLRFRPKNWVKIDDEVAFVGCIPDANGYKDYSIVKCNSSRQVCGVFDSELTAIEDDQEIDRLDEKHKSLIDKLAAGESDE